MIVRTVISILTYVWLSMASDPVGNQNETATNSNVRILYGEMADVSEYPFMVYLRGATHPCAGTIVSMHWILTAAECLREIDCLNIQIFPLAWPDPENVYAETCSYHEKYIPSTTFYNIGMVKVTPSIVGDGRAKVAKFPVPGTHYPLGTTAVFPGWGWTERGTRFPNLQQVGVRLDDWKVCNQAFRGSFAYKHCKESLDCPVPDIAARVICTQAEGPEVPAFCRGDVGGPLIVGNGYIIGVASILLEKGTKCIVNSTMVFVDVSDYLPWIYQRIDWTIDTSNFPVRPEHEYVTTPA